MSDNHIPPKRQAPSVLSRTSLSLPQDLLQALDVMVAQRGFESRSQAITEMIHQQITVHQQQLGQEVMVGTITLLYDRSTPHLQRELADLQYQHLAEVISSLHVQLAGNLVMEVVLVQGVAATLQQIADQLITLKGVVTGRLQLLTAVMPPVCSPVG